MKKAFWLIFFSFSFVLFTVFLYFMTRKPLPKERLKILVYSSFAGVYGPGTPLKKDFEGICDCQIQWFLAEDSNSLLQKFLIIPNIDMVIGWDQITKRSATKEELWENLSFLKNRIRLKNSFLSSDHFIPFDWSPIGFIYKDKSYQISSLKELKNFKALISFPDPQNSSLGLQFYYWIYEVFKGDMPAITQFLKEIREKVYGPVFSWSMAYGFFREGQSQMGLSYLSSLIYHKKEEPEKEYFFAEFLPAHPYQIEFFSISKKSKNKKLAVSFARFLLSKKGQAILFDKNYMLPVSKQANPHPFKIPKLLNYEKLDSFMERQKELMKLWKKQLN